MSEFDDAVNGILKSKGYVANSDLGKASKFGITQRAYTMWRSDHGLSRYMDVRNITHQEARAIHREKYWVPAHCDDLPPEIRSLHFTTAVTYGVKRAILILQDAANVEQDGHVGPITLGAVNAAPPKQLRERYIMAMGAARRDANTRITDRIAMVEPPWLTEARKYIGTREIPGEKYHPKIFEWWRAIKRGGIKSDEVPWCAAFVGGCLEAVGIISSRYESAKSYLGWGVQLHAPVVGCIAVFSRAGGGHVGFVVADDGNGRLMILGGNQADRVSIVPFDKGRVVDYRWPTSVPVPTQPLRVIGSDARSSTNEV